MKSTAAIGTILAALHPVDAVAAPPGPLWVPPINLAVVQPLPGIGDMVWHLPHLRALADAAGHPVTLVAKRGSHADQMLAAEPSVGGFVWLRGSTSGSRGVRNVAADMGQLIGELRARRFDAIVILHQSLTLALVAKLAGIPRRHGYGYGMQRLFLNRPPFLAASVWHTHPYRQASAWLAAAGIASAQVEPVLPVGADAIAAVHGRLGRTPSGLVAIGIGSSEANKQWGAARFADLVVRMRDAGWSRSILVGGPAEADLAADIQARAGLPTLLTAIGWPLDEVAALLARVKFFVGNDTGATNIAAAVGVRSYCLFGATPPLQHSTRIVPIVPPGGLDRVNGMAAITTDAVMAAILAEQPRAAAVA